MKRILFVTLLSIILLQSCGLLLYYQLQQNHVQNRMQELLANPESKFETLLISLNSFENSRINAHEICLDGKMYDVKLVKVTGDRVQLSVIADIVEESIIEKIKNCFGINKKQENKVPIQDIKFFSLVYLLPSLNLTIVSIEKSKNIFYSLSENLLCHNSEILTPPPREM